MMTAGGVMCYLRKVFDSDYLFSALCHACEVFSLPENAWLPFAFGLYPPLIFSVCFSVCFLAIFIFRLDVLMHLPRRQVSRKDCFLNGCYQ